MKSWSSWMALNVITRFNGKKCWDDQDERILIVEIINYICNDANVLFDLDAKKLGLSKMKSCW